jgi:hypothetical protein
MIQLKYKVDMMPATGDIQEKGNWNNTDLKVMIQWFKWDGDKAMPQNKNDFLLCYHKTCTCAVEAVTCREDDITGVAVDIAVSVAIATSTVGVGDIVPSAAVGGTGVLWSLNTVTVARPLATAAAARPPPDADTRTTAAAARPQPDADTRTAAARPIVGSTTI